MLLVIKKLLPFVCILGLIGVLGITLGITGSSLVKYDVNNNMYVFDLFGYLNNIEYGFNNFKENISTYYTFEIYFGVDIGKSLKTIANFIIALLNINLLPFALIGNILNIILSIIGLPMNDTNFLYNIFNGVSELQIPYLT